MVPPITFICSLALLLTVLGAQAKECAFNIYPSQIQRANGTTEYVDLIASSWMNADTVHLGPGDTLHLSGNGNGYCWWIPMTGTLIHNNVTTDTKSNPLWQITESGFYTMYSATSEYTDVARFFVNSAPLVKIEVTMCLGGAFDPLSMTMRDDLRAQGLVKMGLEPDIYSGYYEPFFDRWMTDSTVLAVQGTNAIVDWVYVELRDELDPSTRLVVTQALLQRDGDVVDMDGVTPIAIIAPAGNYHVAVRHNNHLGAMTATPIALSAISTTLNFADPALPTFGIEAQKMVNGIRCLWPGNVDFYYGYNQVPKVSYAGPNNDRDRILFAIGGADPTATYAYPNNYVLAEDVNMDGIVKYAGANNDRDIILQTIGGTDPTAIRYEQIPY